jgi:hypothetical protein
MYSLYSKIIIHIMTGPKSIIVYTSPTLTPSLTLPTILSPTNHQAQPIIASCLVTTGYT